MIYCDRMVGLVSSSESDLSFSSYFLYFTLAMLLCGLSGIFSTET